MNEPCHPALSIFSYTIQFFLFHTFCMLRMWDQDIRGSIAYAKGIAKVGIITSDEEALLISGLGQVREEWKNESFVLKPGDEDIHTAMNDV